MAFSVGKTKMLFQYNEEKDLHIVNTMSSCYYVAIFSREQVKNAKFKIPEIIKALDNNCIVVVGNQKDPVEDFFYIFDESIDIAKRNIVKNNFYFYIPTQNTIIEIDGGNLNNVPQIQLAVTRNAVLTTPPIHQDIYLSDIPLALEKFYLLKNSFTDNFIVKIKSEMSIVKNIDSHFKSDSRIIQ